MGGGIGMLESLRRACTGREQLLEAPGLTAILKIKSRISTVANDRHNHADDPMPRAISADAAPFVFGRAQNPASKQPPNTICAENSMMSHSMNPGCPAKSTKVTQAIPAAMGALDSDEQAEAQRCTDVLGGLDAVAGKLRHHISIRVRIK